MVDLDRDVSTGLRSRSDGVRRILCVGPSLLFKVSRSPFCVTRGPLAASVGSGLIAVAHSPSPPHTHNDQVEWDSLSLIIADEEDGDALSPTGMGGAGGGLDTEGEGGGGGAYGAQGGPGLRAGARGARNAGTRTMLVSARRLYI